MLTNKTIFENIYKFDDCHIRICKGTYFLFVAIHHLIAPDLFCPTS